MEASGECVTGFYQEALPNSNYTWTMTSFLGQLISDAEDMFGRRDMSWTILGVNFHKGAPNVWFPGTFGPNFPKRIAIRIADDARNNFKHAVFMLAHEVIHTLAPVVGGNTNVLEEGIASWFADQSSRKYDLNHWTTNQSYLDAMHLVEKIINVDDGLYSK